MDAVNTSSNRPLAYLRRLAVFAVVWFTGIAAYSLWQSMGQGASSFPAFFGWNIGASSLWGIVFGLFHTVFGGYRFLSSAPSKAGNAIAWVLAIGTLAAAGAFLVLNR